MNQVWTPTAGSTTTQIQNQPLPQPTVQTLSAPPVARNAMPSSNPAGGNYANIIQDLMLHSNCISLIYIEKQIVELNKMSQIF